MSVAYPKTFRGSDRQRDWRKARRICAEEIFDFYFLLGTPKGDISRSELQLVTQLSNEPDRLTAILKDMMREGRLPRLLELVGDVIDELDEVGVRGFCQSLLEMGDELPNYQSSSIDLGTDIQIAMLAYQALQRLTQEERCLWLHDQISSGPSLFMPAYIVFQSEPPKGKPEEELLFSEKCLISLEAACVQKIAARAELGQLQNMKNLPYILFRWRKWADDEKPVQHFIETMLKTPVTALELLAGFMWQGSKYTYGDYVEQREWQLNLEDLSKFVDLKRLESLLMPISEQDAGVKSERHRLALVEFRNALQGKMSSASFAEEE
jgi:predicted KAP-like P-loop ATPase